MSNEVPSQHEIATRILSEATGELSLREQPVEIQDAASDYTAAVKDILATGQQLATDLAGLQERRNLIPLAGLNQLRNEAVTEATSRADEASRRADQALTELKSALTEAALPKIDPAREQLSRDEARIALGGAEGDRLVARAMNIATDGSPEAVAVLFSSFFKTMMAARGVSQPERAIAQLKTVAASVAPERGATERERLAGQALARLGGLPAAKTSAMLHLSDVSGRRRSAR